MRVQGLVRRVRNLLWLAVFALLVPAVTKADAQQTDTSPNRCGLPPFYELHVWAWRANPHGAFVDWNTRVSCEGQ
jgi:hypothetical protein